MPDRFQKFKKTGIEGRVIKGERRIRESMWRRKRRGRRSGNSSSRALLGLDTPHSLKGRQSSVDGVM